MASFSVPCPKSSALASYALQKQNPQKQQRAKISLFSSPKPRSSLLARSLLDQPLFPRFQGPSRNRSTVLKAQVNEVTSFTPGDYILKKICYFWLLLNSFCTSKVAVEKPPTKLEVPSSDGKDVHPANEPDLQAAVSDGSISAFMAEVADLVKLVDSRDIMELQLKQKDCELIIRKKEALPQPPAAPVYMIQPPPAQAMLPSQQSPAQFSSPPVASGPSLSASSSAPALPAPSGSSKSSHPPLKCPMAGTFYQCPAPGEPPFVKVGDKVKKGQVICIIEAMKLMNEIEADQSGTVVEVIAKDGKPVSVDTPLFIIEP
ncbi:biotin carboxyl carrier protein of acetyl-CoA carboxylase, chloroplastic-like isoform X1 [Tasmannia lanceolata]|uniref:biotin carboxyl carrier protein of acetyl-CoA carboxylase, chloroplastic-like isoform X1 n=1 Tax=Tasmannia lanceolata TaxID=3420 RepID=UPI00406483AC